MKHLLITLFSCCIVLSAMAQNADTTTAIVGKKLNFERPTILINNYFDGVKAHLSAEGRKEWKPEFKLRKKHLHIAIQISTIFQVLTIIQ